MTIKNADVPAMPMNGESIDTLESWSELTGGGMVIPVSGLSKREMMAMHILPSLIEAYEIDHVATYGEGVVRDAVIYADLLLAELERMK